MLTSDLYPERHAIAAKFGLKNPIHAGSAKMLSNEYWRRQMAAAPMPSFSPWAETPSSKPPWTATRCGGKVMLFAQTQHGDATFDPGAVCMDEKTLMGSYSSSFDILDEVTDLVFDGYRNGFDLTQLISHRFPIEEAVAAIDVASHPKADSMKIMIEPVSG